jgi:hypothetical protein
MISFAAMKRWRRHLNLLWLAVIATLVAQRTEAQCFAGGFTPGALYKTTGHSQLDQAFNQEGNLISSLFGVTPQLFIIEDGHSPNAYADGPGNRLLFGIRLLADELWSMDRGGTAVAGITAHEFAHILQWRTDPRNIELVRASDRELHADFMAGYYLARKSKITPIDLPGFARSLYKKGGYDFTNPLHHGTPAERVDSMRAGFACKSTSARDAYRAGVKYLKDKSSVDDDDGKGDDEDEEPEVDSDACTTCSGTGKVEQQCGACDGAGTVQGDCRVCVGSGVVQCRPCLGTGGTRCRPCNGTGGLTCIYGACQGCNYSGYLICGTCRGAGGFSCNVCDGSGTRPCTRCSAGKTENDCTKCRRRGVVSVSCPDCKS